MQENTVWLETWDRFGLVVAKAHGYSRLEGFDAMANPIDHFW